eukprot:CAMPEP_0113625122 /NCGR_PEP_ID=MMETSP0017_2-20120614/12973_1 /TAXON_ID=2856 /ORGANISM="Cylindrotheca closterium" /LENGTH=265 /DNA_ID=CAMNT_0000535219 /DNA_START=262 /DNA_END=1059 /DNA_ORIENTATION=+ /assembly_acc=CAM_ASM_000147
MPLWDSVKAGAAAAANKAADATKIAAHKTKLKADLVLCDRDINNCKKAFGVSMYDHISPLSQTADFYAANDDLTEILRPPLIIAQKEIQALAAKRVKLKEDLAAAEARRAGAFPTPAETAGQKVINFGKASAMHSNETKIKAEISMLDARIKGFKQEFGLSLFAILVEAEDTRGYLPSDRQVRSIYDQTRQDINKLLAKKEKKSEELKALSGGNTESSNTHANNSNTHPMTTQQQTNGAFSDNPSSSTNHTDTFTNNQDPDLLML